MYTESKAQNMSNVMVLTKLFTTVNSHGVVKLTRKLTPLDSRPNKGNNIHIYLNVPIAKRITRLTLAIVSSGNTDSTESSTPKNIQKFKKIGKNQFIQL